MATTIYQQILENVQRGVVLPAHRGERTDHRPPAVILQEDGPVASSIEDDDGTPNTSMTEVLSRSWLEKTLSNSGAGESKSSNTKRLVETIERLTTLVTQGAARNKQTLEQLETLKSYLQSRSALVLADANSSRDSSPLNGGTSTAATSSLGTSSSIDTSEAAPSLDRVPVDGIEGMIEFLR